MPFAFQLVLLWALGVGVITFLAHLVDFIRFIFSADYRAECFLKQRNVNIKLN